MTHQQQLTNRGSYSGEAQLIPILLVDDDPIVIMSLKRAMKAQHFTNPTTVAKDGVQALEILRDWVGEKPKLPPVMILLDINMPRMNGLEFLAELRNDTAMKQAVVFVNSSSELPADISAAYDKNVAGYLVKGISKKSAAKAVNILQCYTLGIAFPC